MNLKINLTMKRFKFIYLLAAVVGALSFASCQHPYADWAPGAQDTNTGVYFPETKDLVVTAEDSSVDILVKRSNTAEEATVPVRYEDISSCGFFTIPANVKFAAGEAEAKLTIAFDGTQLVPGVQYPILIKLNGDDASQYGVSEHIFKIGIAEPWIHLGTGSLRDDIFPNPYGCSPGTIIDVEFYQHEFETNRYRIIDPFNANTLPYIIGGVPEDIIFNEEEVGYLEFILGEDGVTVTLPADGCPLGFQMNLESGFENMWLVPYPMDGSAAPGKFENNVFWFTTPANMVFMNESGNGWYANTNALFAAALPGAEITDYAMGAVYGGIFVESDNVTAKAIINFGVGIDVESFKFTVVPGNVTEPASVIEAIVAGSEELTIYDAKASELSWEISLESAGVYTVVAVPYGKGEAQVEDAIAYAFYYPGCNTEIPTAEISVYFDSVYNLTQEEEYEEKFPAAYWAAPAIVANADELRSIFVWVGSYDVAYGSGLELLDIAMGYGTDYSDKIATIKKNSDPETGRGSVILGPFNLQSGSNAVAIVAIETLYGETQLFAVDHTLDNATGLVLGDYTITETVGDNDFKLAAGFIGGYAPGEVTFICDGFEFVGTIDATAKTLTFDGTESQYGPIFNVMSFYYNKEKTQAYGYWSCSDENLQEGTNLVFSYDDAGIVNALNNYFAMCIFNLSDGALAGFGFYFTPEATVARDNVEEEQPEPSAIKASAKSVNAELSFASPMVASTIEAKPFVGERKIQMTSYTKIR